MKRLLIALCLSAVCATAGARKPFIDWANLRNPVYSHPGWSVKDASMVYDRGWFYIFFSAFYHDAGKERSHVSAVRTRDFREFSEPLFVWSGREDGWEGAASPDVVRHKGRYYMTFNTWGDKPGKPNQLMYATSTDLVHWTGFLPLAADITAGVRSIDAAVAFDRGRVMLVYKREQTPQVATAPRIDSPQWDSVGRPMGDTWFENAQFIRIDGRWWMLATHKGHKPYLSRIDGDGSDPRHWLRYGEPGPCVVPKEGFNTSDLSNAASLCDFRSRDGYFYLLYAGTTENKSHAGRGDNTLALARSKDLVTWEVPGAGAR